MSVRPQNIELLLYAIICIDYYIINGIICNLYIKVKLYHITAYVGKSNRNNLCSDISGNPLDII